jgi:hypothetical protein
VLALISARKVGGACSCCSSSDAGAGTDEWDVVLRCGGDGGLLLAVAGASADCADGDEDKESDGGSSDDDTDTLSGREREEGGRWRKGREERKDREKSACRKKGRVKGIARTAAVLSPFHQLPTAPFPRRPSVALDLVD